MSDIIQIISPVKQLSGNRLQSFFRALISHDITDLGQSDQYARTVFIAEPALDIKLREKFIVNPARLFGTFR